MVSRWSERRREIWGGEVFWRGGMAAEKGRRWEDVRTTRDWESQYGRPTMDRERTEQNKK